MVVLQKIVQERLTFLMNTSARVGSYPTPTPALTQFFLSNLEIPLGSTIIHHISCYFRVIFVSQFSSVSKWSALGILATSKSIKMQGTQQTLSDSKHSTVQKSASVWQSQLSKAAKAHETKGNSRCDPFLQHIVHIYSQGTMIRPTWVTSNPTFLLFN